MLIDIKEKFYSLIKSLGYNITDNAQYKENFPWIMIRTNGFTHFKSYDIKHERVLLVLDIFSTYNGEKEIIEIIENINDNLEKLYENLNIIHMEQKDLIILNDKESGPTRKHGVATYSFVMSSGNDDKGENDETNTERN